ncbi:hypothetical protein ACIQ9P_08045 [Kitasatospora sp. NPDC094019]|uniref:hypothetical protein n=1 Tax=Kitasatospora sp. NPDC094019 TaxID=3364091 RepID=UPI003816D502
MDVTQTVEAAIPALLAIAGPVLAGAEEAVTQTSASLGRRLLERLFRLRSGDVVPTPAEPLPMEAQQLVREAVRQAVLQDPVLLERLESLVQRAHVLNVGQGVAMVTNHGPVTLNFSRSN